MEPVGGRLYRLGVVTPMVIGVLLAIVPIWVLLIVDHVAVCGSHSLWF
jgi:hypothetical protein